ncbi:CapA family protein [Candidatus Dojkabacteria bacterium]|nr:CapA family protein [Candidatus Dojkabacteria bacterium]
MISKVAVTYDPVKRKRPPCWLILLVLLTFPVFFYFFYPKYEGGKISDADVDKDAYYLTNYYIPQTHFKTVGNSVTLDELKTREIYFSENISEDEIGRIKDLLELTETSKIKPDFNTFSSLSKDAILIVYPFEKDIRLKSLAVEGVHLFDKMVSLEDYPLKTEVLTSKDKEGELADTKAFAKDQITTLSTGGEMILARAVDRLWLNRTDNAEFLFERIRPYIQDADLALAMLENSYLGDPVPCTGCTTFVSDEKVIPAFKNVGFDVLSLAGNHAGDAGSKGYANTKRLLDEAGIKNFGTGDNIEFASSHTIVEANGIKFAFLGADDVAYFYWAGEEYQGINSYSKRESNGSLTIDREKIMKDIEEAKSESDFVVVFMSWGIEYKNYATTHQREMAKEFVLAGADLVLGSHPHWVQNVEVMENSDGESIPVWYSLGNLIFDQTHTDPTREGIIVNFTLYKGRLLDMRMIPHKTCGYHQSSNNLADRVVAGEITYEEVDRIPENQGCVWWQPTPVFEEDPLYVRILERVWEYTSF